MATELRIQNFVDLLKSDLSQYKETGNIVYIQCIIYLLANFDNPLIEDIIYTEDGVQYCLETAASLENMMAEQYITNGFEDLSTLAYQKAMCYNEYLTLFTEC